jgi:hypothetical protein
MNLVTPYQLKKGDHFRFSDQRISVYVFTGIRKNYSHIGVTDVMYADQIEPNNAWCWWDLSMDPGFSKIVKIEP